MKKLVVYIKNFMLKLSFLLKASWQSFYQRLFLAWRIPLNGVCTFLLLIMVVIVSCSAEFADTSTSIYDVKMFSKGLKKGKLGAINFVFPQKITRYNLNAATHRRLHTGLIELSGVGGKKGDMYCFWDNIRCYFELTPKDAGVLTLTIPAGSFTYDDSGDFNQKITADFIVSAPKIKEEEEEE